MAQQLCITEEAENQVRSSLDYLHGHIIAHIKGKREQSDTLMPQVTLKSWYANKKIKPKT